MENVENTKNAKTLRIVEYVFVLLFLAAVVAAEIYRIVCWNFTWDESLTYIHFIKPIFFDQNPTFGEVIEFFNERTGYWCAMNNHLLNTLSMSAAAKLFFPVLGYGNEGVLRMPIFGCFCLYVGAVLYMFVKKRINWLGVFLLCGARYMMDFFALARGYAMAATFVFLACITIYEWEEKPEKEWRVILAVFWVTLGILAQSVTLLIAAPIYLWLLIRILQKKIFLHFLKPLRLIVMLLLVVINGAMVAFHFAVSAADKCLAPSGDTRLKSVLMNMFIGEGYGAYIDYFVVTAMLLVFLIGGWILFFRKKTSWQSMCFPFIITVYLIPMTVITNTVRLGLPVARMLLPAYPVMILAIYVCIRELSKNLPKFSVAIAMLCVLAVLDVWRFQPGMSASIEWPCCQGIKDECYTAFLTGTKVVPPEEDTERSESWAFYRDKIKTRYGYDVIDDQ